MNRFYYAKSHVYGWAVYDRAFQMPAYGACYEYLPHHVDECGTTTSESPVLLTEYQAMNLCRRLNMAYRKTLGT